VSQTRVRSTALRPGQSSLEGKRIRCHRCWAAGRFVRRSQDNWPPWYVEWVRPALPPASEPLTFTEAQAAPMAHSYCPACRTRPSDDRSQFRHNLLLWASLGPRSNALA